jgi:hypothetical protein
VSEWASAAIHSRRHVVDGVITIDFACCLSTSNVCCPQQTYASLLGFQAGHPVFVPRGSAVHSRRHAVHKVITIDFTYVCCPQQAYASPLGFQAGQAYILQFSLNRCVPLVNHNQPFLLFFDHLVGMAEGSPIQTQVNFHGSNCPLILLNNGANNFLALGCPCQRTSS